MDPAAEVNVSSNSSTGGTADAVAAQRVTPRTGDGREGVATPQSVKRLPDGTERLSLGGTDLSELNDALRRSGGAAAVIPVVAEELDVERRSVETGRVRVTKRVEAHEEVVDAPVLTEEVLVERVPVNQFVDAAPQPRQEGDVLVLPVLEEVVVVERRLRLKEEIRITKRVTEARDPQTVTLRSEDVKIERIAPPPEGQGT